jgi:aldehyde dehydrogenase (NAD+)
MSGHGSWTGKYGFDAFSHQRTSLDSPGWMDYLMNFRNPPYTVNSFSVVQPLVSQLTRSQDGKRALVNALTRPPLPPRIGETSWDSWKTIASGVVLTVGSLIAARKVV